MEHKVYYRVDKIPPQAAFLGHMSSIRILHC
jgi:hypothetical protein